MALANRRPVAFPVSEATSTSSPSFKPSRLSLDSGYSVSKAASKKIAAASIKESTPEESLSGSSSEDVEASPTSSVATTVSTGSTKHKEKKEKKEKVKGSSRQPIATGISTTIPVTGERPRPQEHKSLDDNVLFAIFEILYEKDPEGKGMTVKQICDILVERHPEMANLSSKTSNLVSAKLNAYVKRIEKGEKSLIYALSREWADASPKRMVYVYRGMLAPDFFVHALAAIETQKAAENTSSAQDRKSLDKALKEDTPTREGEMKRRATAFDLGINRNSFADLQLDLTLPNIAIPYSSAPVTASLGIGATLDTEGAFKKALAFKKDTNTAVSDDDFDAFDQFDDSFDTDDIRPSFRANKRSKSMSYLQSKKMRTLTVAAAAPRLSKAKSTSSPSAAAAAAALHAAALEGLSPASVSSPEYSSNETPVAAKWLQAVRNGFLTQDIETPESTSLAELDSMFA